MSEHPALPVYGEGVAARTGLRPDPFMSAILVAAVTATFLPAAGAAAVVLGWVTKVAIFALFFLYGVRLEPREAIAGLKNWRLHVTILTFTFVLFPLLGWGIDALPSWIVPSAIAPGILYLTLCPSTVQSSVNFTSIAKGNVAGAIVAATTSNLLGVFLTPLLAAALMTTSGHAVGLDSIGDIAVQILLPFVLGQITRRWTWGFVKAHPRLKYFDQGSIVLVVYGAFSEGAREHMWREVDVWTLVILVVICVLIVALMLWLTWHTARRLGFDRGDAIAIQFCGTKKSLATGLPMATVLFAGQSIGLIMLPLMVFHQIQLLACSALATRYARRSPSEGA